MPKRTDIKSILLIGSGPIIIGQACEFDYSGVQACKALREEGYRVILVNSNPATIMTDPEFADRTYIEPITPEIVEKIIERERPDCLLPTLGGQTALNTAMSLFHSGVLEKYNVEMIGANADAIRKGEDRQLFKDAMLKIGLDVPLSGTAHNMEEARKIATEKIGRYPLIIRPAFTMGGTGGGIAYNKEEFEAIAANGIALSPVSEILIEESLLGWKEYEMEVMRDRADNCVIICSIENFDPMGVHTGDSITVAPAQTLTDKEYQIMRDASFAVIREIGVETGGSNIQFSVDPVTGRMIVIEMNPRVSRSSALASKATGFPIAKIAAKLAVGYTLDEIRNDITRETPACFEPTIDYVVTKIPRFAFEKFVGTDVTLTTAMKSVGEAMAIGRTFRESFQKALRSLEIGAWGFGGGKLGCTTIPPVDEIQAKLATPNAERVLYLRYAFLAGWSVEKIHAVTKIDPWFLEHLQAIVDEEKALAADQSDAALTSAKENGFSDRQIAAIWGKTEAEIRARRKSIGLVAAYRLVDTCAAEFEAYTPYFYSSYDRLDDEARVGKDDKKKIMILGGGPNRIGQGIEFDYCCVHAAFSLKDLGFETLMVNSNPETVSTDYDTSDKLFFEPLTLEDVLSIYEREKVWGVIVQFGGQTPLNLAAGLQANGVNIIGTSVESIDRAEDRKLFSEMLTKLGLLQTPSAIASNEEEAIAGATKVGYPVLVRPSFVLGGRAMQIVYSDEELRYYMRNAVAASPEKPVLIDRFLNDATEVDVDCIADGTDAVIGAIMEHIEQAGVHSGDSACMIPSRNLSEGVLAEIRRATISMAKELNVRGLMNVQFAVKDEKVYVLEVNPRASRTVPFVSKAIGVPLAKLAAQIMAGKTLKELGFLKEVIPSHYSVKEAVLPFNRFPGVDILLGPEMKSTGEVMGIDADYALAYAKTQMAASSTLPKKGNVFVSVRDADKPAAVEVARSLVKSGFTVYTTGGTGDALANAGVTCTRLHKVSEGRPNVLDMLKNGEIALVINTPAGKVARVDEVRIRTTSLNARVPVITTLAAAQAAALAIETLQVKPLTVKSIQEYHGIPDRK
ncbi:carbamoyl-phosphate synthase large subunit [Verrucomicrobium sp. GAS474]|uniref:carbamoyl-phosphate synthase large subunit n=1 Tax=Verrucomicrobium sp. GAS474 TaxID=1882831 RepID=UPI00087CAA29|nr:carbamoyl-phosphate synthase large subunit [Verrucomicrobium sp. GAS474]SDT86419.1 carbamoyl-phosphate synthase large subunit [Verrucomicrobium sp. GAS474]